MKLYQHITIDVIFKKNIFIIVLNKPLQESVKLYVKFHLI